MHKTVVINVVGLTPSLIGQHTPRLRAWQHKTAQASIKPIVPAVTCSMQATYLTGKMPSEHGIVGNGWYFRDECEVKFWRQSNKLVQAPKIWEAAKALDPSFTCANLFWWYNMYSSADVAVTPRPMYPADGRKLPDIYSQPAELRDDLQRELGQFPLFNFWGPNSSIASSRWIASSAKTVEQRYNPTLSLIYLPHLDYCFQQYGANIERCAAQLAEIDQVVGDLLDFYAQRNARIIILSEYGITSVNRPVAINRLLRAAGLIAVREELGRELLDAGVSKAFAVADHQVAHVYVNDLSYLERVKALLEATPGIAKVLDAEGKREYGLDHERAGELVAIAEADAWFSYYYWLDDQRAPDFARAVDIHRKPGYDPAELFVDPSLRVPMAKIGMTLAKKKLGFRYVMDVIGLDPTVVRGSHGVISSDPDHAPLLLTNQPELLPEAALHATDVYQILWRHLIEG
ncbi:alkaline phosphatase family protein [Herpetosiphon geysericola]|uniref:Phosphodiesterase n=1 Tax=Herpetosiphon geysericola TaxID=70996 RepID=A0A0P6Z2V2_9CHLR|nr:nucleotide pyrophosphatase/phosphodiesterase family protein [Herpetosiphon geysericola]KPL91640.1 phosphodiesterase [Herpetosiphon geysericola]